ncbi:MAG: NifB/NifX family molybdenum-iron cluster-binding protein [Gammaproteobacteria bacterium]
MPADSGDGLKAKRAGHFGKCAYYILVDVKDNQVQQVTPLRNGGHVKGGCTAPVMLLNGNHVKQLIVAGIGGRPLQGFRETGIEVYTGEGVTVEETVNIFLDNKLLPISNDQVCGGGPQ